MTFVSSVLAEAEHVEPLIAPSWVFGVVALIVFAVLAVITWTYRDVANRHSHKAPPDAASHAGGPGVSSHGTGH